MNDYLIKLACNNEEKLLIARLNELVQKAAHGLCGQSDFMDLRQQELATAVAVNGSAIGWQLNGGYEEAERKRLLVYPEWQLETETWIAYLRINHREFKEQSIGHRDYLGALLNLGIKREKMGDIVLQNSGAFLIVDMGLADYICQELLRVKNYRVWAERVPDEAFVYEPPETTSLKLSLASLRLDAAIAASYNLSRATVDKLIEAGYVKLNHREIYKCSAPLKAGDLITVRGRGRFRLEKLGEISRKGRYRVEISRW